MNLNPSCVNIYVCDHISPTDPLIREKHSLQSLTSALSDHKHIICMLWLSLQSSPLLTDKCSTLNHVI